MEEEEKELKKKTQNFFKKKTFLTQQQRRRDNPREGLHGEIHPRRDQLRPQRVDARLADDFERQKPLQKAQQKGAEGRIVEQPPGDRPENRDLVRRQNGERGGLAVADDEGGNGAAAEGGLGMGRGRGGEGGSRRK